MLNEEGLRDFLRNKLRVDDSQVRKDSPLFSTGLIDSFALVTLLAYIEKAVGVRIAPTDVTLDNFDSIERILEFTARDSS
jgi:acyl carrier protein